MQDNNLRYWGFGSAKRVGEEPSLIQIPEKLIVGPEHAP